MEYLYGNRIILYNKAIDVEELIENYKYIKLIWFEMVIFLIICFYWSIASIEQNYIVKKLKLNDKDLISKKDDDV